MGVMIARVAIERRMDRQIGNHAPRHELLDDERTHKGPPLIGRQLVRQGEIDLARQLGVLTLLHRPGVVPELLAVSQPWGCAVRQQDLVVHDATTAHDSHGQHRSPGLPAARRPGRRLRPARTGPWRG